MRNASGMPQGQRQILYLFKVCRGGVETRLIELSITEIVTSTPNIKDLQRVRKSGGLLQEDKLLKKLFFKDVFLGSLKSEWGTAAVHPQFKEPLEGVGTARGSLHPSTHLEGLPKTAISQDLALLGPLKGFIRYLTHDSTKTREKYGVKGVSLI